MTIRCCVLSLLSFVSFISNPAVAADEQRGVIELGDRRELFIDNHLIARMDRLSLRLHHPQPAPPSNAPPESGAYSTILHDGDRFLLYYRGTLEQPGENGKPQYAYFVTESKDGIHWRRPELNLFPGRAAHMILEPDGLISHNFSPLIDARPGVPASQRFKALGGGGRTWANGDGLYAMVSADGFRWSKLRDEPVIPEGKDSEHYFDSQNVAFWSQAEERYVCYYRTWLPKVKGKRGIRGISRSTSDDFIHWTPGVQLPVNEPDEQLYTNQTQPYFRAPHVYVALPLRFLPWAGGDIHHYPSDTVLMTARGAAGYVRTFKEAFIRPPADARSWDRAFGPVSTSATLGIIPTGEREMSIYLRKARYVLRTDGFASLHAGGDFGEMVTKPFTFAGDKLELNVATAAAGRVFVELQDGKGHAIPGYTLDDCELVVGDEIACVVRWKGGDGVGRLAGQPIRMRLRMRDADLYAFRFR